MKLVFRKSFWNDCSEPDRKTISLPFNFRLAAAEGSGEEPNKKIERKWFWRTARRVERGESGAVVLRELPLNSPSGELVQNYYRLSPWRACARRRTH